MFKKTIVILSIILAIVALSLLSLNAQPPQGPGFKHADKNKDGVVDKKEWNIEKREAARYGIRVKNWWQRRADTNGNGIVDNDELAAWKKLEKEHIDLNNDGVIDAKEQRLCWRHARSRVNTPLEKKYDINSDGWLQPDETRELLKDKHTLIRTQGKAKVDTEVESEYDTNKDGVIDSGEAKVLKEDLGLN
jgi:hypothetical protein